MTDLREKNRLSRIVTTSGDAGTTGLADGSRLSKSDHRVHALGAVDELSAVLGLWRCELSHSELESEVEAIQQKLFAIGGELALPGFVGIQAADVEHLSAAIAAINQHLPPLKEFVLPAPPKAAALAHLARTHCRRAERYVVAVAENHGLNPATLSYLNRLSDWCFVVARRLQRDSGQAEQQWQR